MSLGFTIRLDFADKPLHQYSLYPFKPLNKYLLLFQLRNVCRQKNTLFYFMETLFQKKKTGAHSKNWILVLLIEAQMSFFT